MDKLKLSTANLVILVAGAVMLIASFLAFNKYSVPSVASAASRSAAGRSRTARGAATSS